MTYVSCTCRESSVNYWTTAYIELSLPESGLLDDSEIVFLSFDQDSTGNYTAGFWGDSDPIPNGTSYEDLKTEFIPYFVGKTYGELKDLSTIDDIVLEDYQAGEGREAYEIDALTGASVSSNNVIRMIQAIYKYHGTDPFFENDPSLSAELEEVDEEDNDEVAEEVSSDTGESIALLELPPASKEEGNYSSEMSTINSSNLTDYLGRSDVLYIDVRDYEDYAKKHLRNFESISYFAFIWNAEAYTNDEMIQLYGGEEADPIPVYEESDKILEVLFPKDKTIFIMCQSGGRVENLMKILAARGWDMSKIYNIGGLARYTGSQYRDLTTDIPEFTIEVNYSVEGLTSVESAE